MGINKDDSPPIPADCRKNQAEINAKKKSLVEHNAVCKQ